MRFIYHGDPKGKSRCAEVWVKDKEENAFCIALENLDIKPSIITDGDEGESIYWLGVDDREEYDELTEAIRDEVKQLKPSLKIFGLL